MPETQLIDKRISEAAGQTPDDVIDLRVKTLADTIPEDPSRVGEFMVAAAITSSTLLGGAGIASAESGTPPQVLIIDERGDTLSEVANESGADWRTANTDHPDYVKVGDSFLACKAGQDLMPKGWNATIFSARNNMTLTSFKLANPDVTDIDKVSADRCYNVTAGNEEVSTNHVVRPGDTIDEIAGGNINLRNQIMTANSLTMLPGGIVMIYPGEVLRIPSQSVSMPELGKNQNMQEQRSKLLSSPVRSTIQLPSGEYISNLAEAISRVSDGEINVTAVQKAIIDNRGGNEHFQLGETLTVPGVSQNLVDMAAGWMATDAIINDQPVVAKAAVGAEASAIGQTEFERQWKLPIGDEAPFADETEAQAFMDAVKAMSNRLGFAPDYVMAVMSFETGGTFDPAVRNGAGSGATGLIQFMPGTARGLGTTTEQLARMSPVEQLTVVEQYFASSAGQLHTLNDVYLKVFFPAAIGKGADYKLPGWVYRQNSGFDINRDGTINVAEISSTVQERYDQAPLLPVEQPAELVVDQPEAELPVQAEADKAEYHPLVKVDTLRIEDDGIQTIEIGDNLGIRVRVENANDWAELIEEAAANGFQLTGRSSYRSATDQRRLRAENCPNLNSRPGECTPETGWVGDEPGSNGNHSDHLDGEAVDFRVNGQPLTSWDTPESNWLEANAPKHTIHPEVRSEPWHYASEDH